MTYQHLPQGTQILPTCAEGWGTVLEEGGALLVNKLSERSRHGPSWRSHGKWEYCAKNNAGSSWADRHNIGAWIDASLHQQPEKGRQEKTRNCHVSHCLSTTYNPVIISAPELR